MCKNKGVSLKRTLHTCKGKKFALKGKAADPFVSKNPGFLQIKGEHEGKTDYGAGPLMVFARLT